MYRTLHGLILRETKYKESSKILSILTEEEGKITAEAKGAVRKNSKTAAASQLLSWGELTFFENRGRYVLTEGSVLEDFSDLRTDFSAFSLGCYFAELLDALSDADTADPELLHLGLNSLFSLSRKLYPEEHIKSVFELRAMCLAGFEPAVRGCIVCGKPDVTDPYLNLSEGGICCRECLGETAGRLLPLCSASLAAFRHVCGASPKRIFSFTLDEPSSRRFHTAAEGFALTQLDRSFSTLDYWKHLR